MRTTRCSCRRRRRRFVLLAILALAGDHLLEPGGDELEASHVGLDILHLIHGEFREHLRRPLAVGVSHFEVSWNELIFGKLGSLFFYFLFLIIFWLFGYFI